MNASVPNPAAECLAFVDALPEKLAADIRSRLLAFENVRVDARDEHRRDGTLLHDHFVATSLPPLAHKGRTLALRAYVDYLFEHTFSEARARGRAARLASRSGVGDQTTLHALEEARTLFELYDDARPQWQRLRASLMSDAAISAYEHSLWPHVDV